MDKKAQNEKEPLTLDGLARYSREVLLPAIDERFERIDQRFEKVATKEDVAGVKTELKQEIAHVRGAVLTALDENTELLCTMCQEQDATSQAIVRYDEKITQHDKKIEEHDKKIARLQEKVGV